jgi:hypothetical protein
VSEWNAEERFCDHDREFLFLSIFFQSARPCSHLFAVLRLLVDFNDPKVDTMLVSRPELFWVV